MPAVRIDTPTQRLRLKPRREPYWHKLQDRGYLGFRRLAEGGTWIARWRDDAGKQQYQALRLQTSAPEQAFDEAAAEARKRFAHLARGGSTDRPTVKEACEAYVKWLRIEKTAAAADDAEGRFQRLIYSDPLGRVELAKLATRHFVAWKNRALEQTIARNGRPKGKATFNRNATTLRAALNLAKRRREVSSDMAWSNELRHLKAPSGRRTLYLSREQRRALIAAASDEIRPFLRALALMPLRSGEVARFKVAHFDARTGVLMPDGKTGERMIPLSKEATEHFKTCAASKLPSAWLVARADGSQWTKAAWGRQVCAAIAAAKLPKAASAYTLRHSTITDLVTGGLDLFTVAKISGTSVAMIEQYYGHLQQEHARKALEGLALG